MKPALASSLFLLLAVFLTLSPAAANEMKLEIIPLKHRLVDDVIPVLRPLLAPGGTITGMNNQLIIKSTPANIAELNNILQRIDRAARKLMITVKQDTDFAGYSNEHLLEGRYRSDNITIENRQGSGSRDGLIISGGDDEGNVVRYQTQQTETSRDEQHAFRVQTVEGSPAFIQTGQAIPVRNRNFYHTPEGVIVNDVVDYHEATSGFYVLPRLNGEQVTLLAAPRLSRATPGSRPVFNIQDVQTTAHGRLGEWIRLGGLNRSFHESSRGVLSSSGVQGAETGSVLIRVDEIK